MDGTTVKTFHTDDISFFLKKLPMHRCHVGWNGNLVSQNIQICREVFCNMEIPEKYFGLDLK